MNFFNKTKLKAKISVELDKLKFCINYYNVKNSDNLKASFLKELMGQNFCLVTLNTNMLYENESKDFGGIVNGLISELDKHNIIYCKKLVNSENDMKILGVNINIDSKKKHKAYMVGFVINFENFEDIQGFINNYTLHYYISRNNKSGDELLRKFELNYFNEGELSDGFDYDVLDSNFIKQLVIYSTKEGSDLVSNIIDRVNQEE